MEITITDYKLDIDDYDGDNSFMTVNQNLTMRELLFKVSEKYNARFKDFEMGDISYNTKLKDLNHFDITFYDKKGNTFGMFF